MADTAAKLEIVASVRDQMTRVLRTAQTSFQGFFRGVSSGFKSLGNAAASFTKLLVAGFLGGLGVKAIENHIRSIAQLGGEYEHLAARFGTTVEALDELAVVAEQGNLSFDAVKEGVRNLQNQLDKAAQGLAESKALFLRLGIDAVDPTTGRLKSAVDVLTELSAAFERLQQQGRGGEVSRISEALLGTSGGDLSVILSQGPAKLRESLNLAHELGVITTQQARAAGLVGSAFVELERAVQGVQFAFFDVFGPDLIATLKGVAQVIRENRGVIVAFIKDIANFLVQAFKVAAQVVVTVIGGILDAIDFVREAIKSVSAASSDFWKQFGFGMKSLNENEIIPQTATDAARQNLTALGARVGTLSVMWEGFSTRFGELWGKNRAAAVAAIDGVGEANKSQADKATNAWDQFFDGFDAGFKAWKLQLTEWKQFGQQTGTEVFQSLESNSASFFESAIKKTEKLRDAWRNLLRGILDDWIATFSKITSRFFLDAIFNSLFSGLGGGGGGGPSVPGGSGTKTFSGGGGIIPGGGGSAAGASSGGGGGVIVNYHINSVNTIDAKSFGEHLSGHTKTVVAMVESAAMNDQSLRTVLRRR